MKLAVFDFDGTLFLQDTLPFLLKLWRRFKYSRSRLLRVYASLAGIYLRHKIGFHSARQLDRGARAVMRKFTRLFADMSKEQVECFFDRCSGEIIKNLNKDVAQEVGKAKRQGCHIVLLSGCFEYLLEAVGRPLGVDTVIGTKINYRNERVYLKRPLDVVYGPVKISKLRARFETERIEWPESFAYADSISDVPVLELVGNPVAVNPDAGLKRKAEESGWRIM
jgi:HAD superfamily hydrolase (TIGR01490 family)